MQNDFDPYRIWLGIPPAEQPANHYRLLGIPLFETDASVISNAADRQMAHVRTFQSGKYSEQSQKVLNELSAARVVLLDPQKRAAYDQHLRAMMYPPMSGYMPMGGAVMPGMPPMPGGMVPPTVPGGMPPMPPMGGGPMGGVPPMPAAMGSAPGMVPPVSPNIPPVSPNIPPVSTSLPGIQTSPVGGVSRPRVAQKKKDNSWLYVVVGLALLALLLCFFMMSGGKQTAKAPQEENSIEKYKQEYAKELAEQEAATSEEAKKGMERDYSEVVSPSENAVPTAEEKAEEDASDSNFVEEDESVEEAKAKEESEKSKEDEKAAKVKKNKKKKTKEAEEVASAEKSEKGETSKEEEKPKEPEILPDQILALGKGFDLRQSPKKETMLKFYGADAETQNAIAESLQWLSRRQLQDGSWCFNHLYIRPGKMRPNSGKIENPGTVDNYPNACTALALLAYLGDGRNLKDKEYRLDIMNGAKYLLMKAKPVSDRPLTNPMEAKRALEREASLVEGDIPDFRSHAWGTMAICEIFGETKDTLYFTAAKALVSHIEHQQCYDGGWPNLERPLNVNNMMASATDSNHSSTMATVWNLMTLCAAKRAGIEVQMATFDKATKYLTRKKRDLDNQYREGDAKILVTDLEDYRNVYLGLSLLNDPPEREDLRPILEQLVANTEPGNLRASFMTTLLARDYRGEIWTQWNDSVCKSYLKQQVDKGEERGSWFFMSGDPVRFEGGRTYGTAMTSLVLESYFRYAPLRDLNEKDVSELDENNPEDNPLAAAGRPEQEEPANDEEKSDEEEVNAEPLFPGGLE